MRHGHPLNGFYAGSGITDNKNKHLQFYHEISMNWLWENNTFVVVYNSVTVTDRKSLVLKILFELR